MPVFADILLALKTKFTIIDSKWNPDKHEDENKTPIIGNILFAYLLLTTIVVSLVYNVGSDQLKSDIWANNFLNGMFQGMFMLPIVTVVAQISLIRSLKTPFVICRPNLQKKMMWLMNPDIKRLVVTLLSLNKVN